jgi:hypothetical protein
MIKKIEFAILIEFLLDKYPGLNQISEFVFNYFVFLN